MFYNGDALRVETIYVEADSLRTAQAEFANPALLRPTSFNLFRKEVTFRATNLHTFRFSREYARVGDISATAFYGTSNHDFPHIAFLVEKRDQRTLKSRLYFDGQGLICKLYPNSGPQHYYHIDKGTELASEAIPTDRGATTSILLNDQHELVLRSQMQWKHEGSSLHIDSFGKNCLITLSVVSTSKVAQKLLPAFWNTLSKIRLTRSALNPRIGYGRIEVSRQQAWLKRTRLQLLSPCEISYSGYSLLAVCLQFDRRVGTTTRQFRFHLFSKGFVCYLLVLPLILSI